MRKGVYLTKDEMQKAVDMDVRCHGNRMEAARLLSLDYGTLRNRLRVAALNGIKSKIKPPKQNKPESIDYTKTDLQRQRDQAAKLRSELSALTKQLIRAEDIRTAVLGLGPPRLSKINPPPIKFKSSDHSALLHISDIQYGELIALGELDGVNSYSVEIANARIDRTFAAFISLLTDHWHGKPPECLYIVLGGDMISGSLHLELAKTDQIQELPSTKLVAERLASNIALVRQKLDRPIKIYSVPGNHGRLTEKPESKGYTLNNLDTLVAWLIEKSLSHDKGIEFNYSESVDALFDVYGFPILVQHGDKMGSRGGTGFVGPAATIIRGHQKLFMDYAARGTYVYKILTAHFHTTLETPWGHSNGTMAGLSQYARDFRMMTEPASQNMIVFHPRWGEVRRHRIYCGDALEGTSQNPKHRWQSS